MKEIVQQIQVVLTDCEPVLTAMDPAAVAIKPAPEKWSKKEIFGHLIDSAANNHQRFVRAVYYVADQYPPYNQNEWVRIQRYNDMPWPSLVILWVAYNQHLCRVIERIPAEAASSPCNIGKEECVTLEFIVRDYLRHMRHHLEQIVGEIN